MEVNKVQPYLTPHKKINSEWINDLYINVETINVLESNKREKLHEIEFGNNFLKWN